MPRNRIVESYDSSTFNFLRNLYTVFHSASFSLYTHQQCTRIAFSPYPYQHLRLLIFLIIDILTGTRWYLLVPLHFVVISDVEYLFTSLVVICMPLEKCLFGSFGHCLIGWVFVFEFYEFFIYFVYWPKGRSKRSQIYKSSLYDSKQLDFLQIQGSIPSRILAHLSQNRVSLHTGWRQVSYTHNPGASPLNMRCCSYYCSYIAHILCCS